MNKQVWFGSSELQKDKMKSVNSNKFYFGKPHGGLWTSPYINGSSPWIRFAKSVDLSGVENDEAWVLKPSSRANVLHFNTKRDLMKVETKKVDNYKVLNYRDIFEKYDAIKVSHDLIGVGPFREWDCKSVLWDTWNFDWIVKLSEYENN